MLLAQAIELLHGAGDRIVAEQGVRVRSGTWFDPELIEVFDVITLNPEMWNGLRAADLQERVRACELQAFVVTLTDERLDRIAEAFGGALDARGPLGIGRAARVAELAGAIGRELGLAGERLRWLRRSALLHDACALPGCDDELRDRLDPFRELARNAGQGFQRRNETAEVALEQRIALVAAEYDARASGGPSREPLERDAALAELEGPRGTRLDPNCLDALRRALDGSTGRRAA